MAESAPFQHTTLGKTGALLSAGALALSLVPITHAEADQSQHRPTPISAEAFSSEYHAELAYLAHLLLAAETVTTDATILQAHAVSNRASRSDVRSKLDTETVTKSLSATDLQPLKKPPLTRKQVKESLSEPPLTTFWKGTDRWMHNIHTTGEWQNIRLLYEIASAQNLNDEQIGCADNLVAEESNADTHTDGTHIDTRTDPNRDEDEAYGAFQALPGDKMAKFGSDWRDNPATQIKWGLWYIASRYGTPCDAWAHSERYNYY